MCSIPGVGLMSLVVGLVGGIYGIGGGSIIAPVFVAMFGLPVHVVAGATLMGTLVTSMAGVRSRIWPFAEELSAQPPPRTR